MTGFFLVWDDADPDSVTVASKVRRARYASIEDAQRQGEHDVTIGKKVLRVEDETGTVVWEP